MNPVASARGLGVTALAVALVAAMVWLGTWQLGVYDERQHDDAVAVLDRATMPLDGVLGPDDSFRQAGVGQPVSVTGEYAGREQFFVRGLEGASKDYAVVTPLVTATGSAILVVRGSAALPAADVPVGTVTVEGFLEPPTADGAALDEERVTDGIRIPALVSSFGQDLYGGYVIARESDPPDPLPSVQPPLVESSRWAGIRNLLYAIQWWVFAAFVIFMWWRVLRDAPPSPDDEQDARPRS